MKKSIAKNFVYNLMYQMLIVLLPLITTPYLSRVLHAKAIGIFGYTFSIVTYFVLFGSLGVGMYGQREIAYHQNDKKSFSKIFFEIFLLRFFTLSISILLFYFIYCRSGSYTLYYKILIIQLVATMFDISWFFQGIEEFDKLVVRNLIVKILSLVLIFIFVKEPSDLWKYFVIYVGAEFLGNCSIFVYLPKYLTKIKLKEIEIKKHLKSTFLLFLPQIAIQIYTVLDKTMIGVITNDMAEVGYYEQAQKIVKAGLLVLTALQTVMNSRIANAYATKNHREIKSCLYKSFNFVWFVTIPMSFGLIAIASKFVPWYYGRGFADVTNILIFTIPILIAIGLNGITGPQYLVQIGKQNIFTVSVVIGAIINMILNFILIRFYGAIGAAIASVVAESIIFLVQLHYFKDQFRFREILKLSYKCLISGFIMFVVVKLVTNYLSISIFNTLLETFIGMIVYFGLLYLFNYQFFKDLLATVFSSVMNIIKKVES